MTEAFDAGLELMAVGMGIVFLFLFTLILTANAMSKLVQHFYPEPELVAINTSAIATTGVTATEASVVAAITAAVHQYRSEK